VAEGTDVRTVADLGSRRWAFCEYFKTDTTIIIGSQALLVGWPNAPAIMRTSVEIDAVNRRQDRAPWRHEERVPGSVQRHYCLQSMVEHFSCWVSPVKPEAAVGGGP
jgi:hypothetical protein